MSKQEMPETTSCYLTLVEADSCGGRSRASGALGDYEGPLSVESGPSSLVEIPISELGRLRAANRRRASRRHRLCCGALPLPHRNCDLERSSYGWAPNYCGSEQSTSAARAANTTAET